MLVAEFDRRAFAAGELSYSKVRALVRVATPARDRCRRAGPSRHRRSSRTHRPGSPLGVATRERRHQRPSPEPTRAPLLGRRRVTRPHRPPRPRRGRTGPSSSRRRRPALRRQAAEATAAAVSPTPDPGDVSGSHAPLPSAMPRHRLKANPTAIPRYRHTLRWRPNNLHGRSTPPPSNGPPTGSTRWWQWRRGRRVLIAWAAASGRRPRRRGARDVRPRSIGGKLALVDELTERSNW